MSEYAIRFAIALLLIMGIFAICVTVVKGIKKLFGRD